MRITFLGAAGTVTGSKYLLSFDSKNVLIDCGLYQGYKELRLRNWNPLPIPPGKIDAVILTHAHIDHSGYLPLLVKNGFKGPIYSTPGTKSLCAILLPDSGHLQEEDAYLANKHGFSKHKPALPLYTLKDAEKVMPQFVTIPFEERFTPFEDFNCVFSTAAHILGSALLRITRQGRTITFTGDLGRTKDPIMREPAIIEETDFLITESTYGDRVHGKEPPEEQLKRIINQTAKRGGSIIIPSFAVGRAQSIMYYISLLKEKKSIPDLPVFLDSPMAVNASKLYSKYIMEHRLGSEGCKRFGDVATYVNTIEESKAIDAYHMPSIIISASGMASGGRVLHHIKAYAPNERNTLLFTGYQAGGTRGARILGGESEVKIHGAMVPIRAQVEYMTNTSAHADSEEMLRWFSHFKKPPRKVFITHGEPKASAALKEKIENQFGWRCEIPKHLQEEILW